MILMGFGHVGSLIDYGSGSAGRCVPFSIKHQEEVKWAGRVNPADRGLQHIDYLCTANVWHHQTTILLIRLDVSGSWPKNTFLHRLLWSQCTIIRAPIPKIVYCHQCLYSLKMSTAIDNKSIKMIKRPIEWLVCEATKGHLFGMFLL